MNIFLIRFLPNRSLIGGQLKRSVRAAEVEGKE